MPEPSLTDNRSVRTTMSFDISKNIKTSLQHEYKETKNKNDKRLSGNASSTFLAWGDDPSSNFNGISGDIRSFIPDWSIRITGLEKILFFKNFAKSISLDHSRSGKYNSTKKFANDELVPATEGFTHNYQPFIGLNVNWLSGITSNIRISNSTSINFRSGGDATRTENSSFTITAGYQTKGGFKIPIPIWPFKGASFKNEIETQVHKIMDNMKLNQDYNYIKEQKNIDNLVFNYFVKEHNFPESLKKKLDNQFSTYKSSY